MNLKEWIEAEVNISGQDPIEVARLLLKSGSHGVYIEKNKGLCFHPDFVEESKNKFIYGYFLQNQKTSLREVKNLFNNKVKTRKLSEREISKEENITEINLKGNTSLKIQPLWFPPASHKMRISIMSGLTFGKGDHPTTQSCLREMYEIRDRILNNKLADAGCGTGILSLFGALLGAKKIISFDIDPRAVSIAQFNAHRNGLHHKIKIIQSGFNGIKGSFAVVIANLLTPIILENAGKLAEMLDDQGILILSGILKGEEEEVINNFRDLGFKIAKIVHSHGWICIRFLRLRKEKIWHCL